MRVRFKYPKGNPEQSPEDEWELYFEEAINGIEAPNIFFLMARCGSKVRYINRFNRRKGTVARGGAPNNEEVPIENYGVSGHYGGSGE